MWDIFIAGLLFGFVQLFFYKPLFKIVSLFTGQALECLIKRKSLIGILTPVLTVIPMGAYFLSLVLAKPFVNDWNNFMIGWLVGSFVGGALPAFIFR